MSVKEKLVRFILLLLLASVAVVSSCNIEQVDVKKSIVWGPGIEQKSAYAFNLPVRYFFVQLVDKHGFNFTSRPPDDFLRLNLSGSAIRDGSRCTVRKELIDRKDGFYIVRYKLYASCDQLLVQLTTHDDEHIASSPYVLERASSAYFLTDRCHCPVWRRSEWYRSVQCPSSYPLIEAQLAAWPAKSVNFTEVLASAVDRWAKFAGAHSFCHYQFVSNKIFRKCYGTHVGFKMFSDAIFLSLARKVKLPNMELLMNLGDWPLETGSSEIRVPVTSWCGADDAYDVVFPTYELTESTLEMMGRQSLDVQSVQGYRKYEWRKKLDKGFFRGRDSSQSRLDLVLLAKLEHPKDLDVEITKFFFFRDVMEKYGNGTEHVSFAEFFKYRYQLNLDGTVAAYRLPYLLAGDALVFKQESKYYEHFYKELTPFVHYVPISRNLSDLLDKIDWARANPNKVNEIIRNAQQFVNDRLQPRDVFCYHMKVLEAFSKILSSTPEIAGADMELVHQDNAKCTCSEEADKTRTAADVKAEL